MNVKEKDKTSKFLPVLMFIVNKNRFKIHNQKLKQDAFALMIKNQLHKIAVCVFKFSGSGNCTQRTYILLSDGL